jgi:Pyridoxamine 5'-phosphate oxidase
MGRQMTPEEARVFMAGGTRTAKLATTMGDGHPHVMLVWFVLDGDAIVFTTPEVRSKGVHRAAILGSRWLSRRKSHVTRSSMSAVGRRSVRIQSNCSDSRPKSARAPWASIQPTSSGLATLCPGGLLIRVTPEHVITSADVAGY